MKTILLIIDPENDFCVTEEGEHRGSLVIPGAYDDMVRLSAMINRLGEDIDEIWITLDQHPPEGIERPGWWIRESDQSEPAPFTQLGVNAEGKVVRLNGTEFTDETYVTKDPQKMNSGGPTGLGVVGYLRELDRLGKGPHTIWPVHCVKDTWGAQIVDPLFAELICWELWFPERVGKIFMVGKGMNPWTEHFSGMKAEVVDPADPRTGFDKEFHERLSSADQILVSGEALSHCVLRTLLDLEDLAPKITLLLDTTSPVPGFEFAGIHHIQDLCAKGMTIRNSTDIEL